MAGAASCDVRVELGSSITSSCKPMTLRACCTFMALGLRLIIPSSGRYRGVLLHPLAPPHPEYHPYGCANNHDHHHYKSDSTCPWEQGMVGRLEEIHPIETNHT